MVFGGGGFKDSGKVLIQLGYGIEEEERMPVRMIWLWVMIEGGRKDT